MAELMQAVLRYSKADYRKSTANHHQTNGLTERLNKMTSDTLSIYIKVEYKSWDQILHYATFAYNRGIKKTTQMTSIELVLRRQATVILGAKLPRVQGYDLNVDV